MSLDPQICGWDSHRQPEHLGKVQDRQFEFRADCSGRPLLINVQAHMAKRTGRHHRIGSGIFRFFEIRAIHRQCDRFLLEDNRKAAALDLPAIVNRFRADGADDLLHRIGIFRIIETEVP